MFELTCGKSHKIWPVSNEEKNPSRNQKLNIFKCIKGCLLCLSHRIWKQIHCQIGSPFQSPSHLLLQLPDEYWILWAPTIRVLQPVHQHHVALLDWSAKRKSSCRWFHHRYGSVRLKPLKYTWKGRCFFPARKAGGILGDDGIYEAMCYLWWMNLRYLNQSFYFTNAYIVFVSLLTVNGEIGTQQCRSSLFFFASSPCKQAT